MWRSPSAADTVCRAWVGEGKAFSWAKLGVREVRSGVWRCLVGRGGGWRVAQAAGMSDGGKEENVRAQRRNTCQNMVSCFCILCLEMQASETEEGGGGKVQEPTKNSLRFGGGRGLQVSLAFLGLCEHSCVCVCVRITCCSLVFVSCASSLAAAST